jgi:uncharacterized protein YbjQ (UPF0145 family)
MGFICFLCGKKKSSFGTEYTLADNRICQECADGMDEMRIVSQTNIAKYPEAKSAFLESIGSPATNEANEALEKFIRQCDETYQGLNQKEREEHEAQQRTEERIKSCIKTTGDALIGYDIEQYIDVLSGEATFAPGATNKPMYEYFDNDGGIFSKDFRKAKDTAMRKLVLRSVKAGANALIGIRFEITTVHEGAIPVATLSTGAAIAGGLVGGTGSIHTVRARTVAVIATGTAVIAKPKKDC